MSEDHATPQTLAPPTEPAAIFTKGSTVSWPVRVALSVTVFSFAEPPAQPYVRYPGVNDVTDGDGRQATPLPTQKLIQLVQVVTLRSKWEGGKETTFIVIA